MQVAQITVPRTGSCGGVGGAAQCGGQDYSIDPTQLFTTSLYN